MKNLFILVLSYSSIVTAIDAVESIVVDPKKYAIEIKCIGVSTDQEYNQTYFRPFAIINGGDLKVHLDDAPETNIEICTSKLEKSKNNLLKAISEHKNIEVKNFSSLEISKKFSSYEKKVKLSPEELRKKEIKELSTEIANIRMIEGQVGDVPYGASQIKVKINNMARKIKEKKAEQENTNPTSSNAQKK